MPTVKETYFRAFDELGGRDITNQEIRFLISDHLKLKNESEFYIKYNDEMSNIEKFNEKLQLLLNGMPLEYVTHRTTFLGLHFFVRKGVLIPRPETEELVLLAKHLIIKKEFEQPMNILDMGTGSGVIAICMKKVFQQSNVVASDISSKAINVAKTNITRHKFDIKLVKGAYFEPFDKEQKFNVIISNPPYIRYRKDIDKRVLEHEPIKALINSDGKNFYEEVFKSYEEYVKYPCLMVFEICPKLRDTLSENIQKYFKDKVEVSFYDDINGKCRFLSLYIKEKI